MPATTTRRALDATLLTPIGAGVFTVAWLVLGAISPGYELFGHVIAPYSWIAQPVSGLGLGVTAGWMNAAFIVGGVLVAAGTVAAIPRWRALGGRGTTAVVLMSAMGLGMIVCGVFTLESMMIHLSGFLLAVPVPALGFVFAAAATRSTRPRLAVVGAGGGILTLVLFAIFMITFDATGAGGNAGIAGLTQRCLITVALVTQSLLVTSVPAVPARPPRPSFSRETG
ncbi:DUF998 domain-containing protein [Microbacterium rhizomatis]|uniref:DUF998 domain-containing protein n=1 Tax=Microbacterium rhizomatis TaxID=1631477 RepID=A0A5J5J5P3_9MICO|nr:DUF998 domain-containing protein [Microbacterium rhizomatis]KAA9111466.1 DUF998 domain-containing protein [Microbacterium rhizomatis]